MHALYSKQWHCGNCPVFSPAPHSATKCSGFTFSFSYVRGCMLHVCRRVQMHACICKVLRWESSSVILPLLIYFEAESVSQTHRSLAVTISRANFLWEPLPPRLELQVAATAILHAKGSGDPNCGCAPSAQPLSRHPSP